jgi:hypothetical protein
MLSLRTKTNRAGWLYLTVILLVLYVGRTFPHDHSVSGHAGDHSGHHDTPIPDAHHSHSHDHGTSDETGPPWQPHHHHLAQHVDSHFLFAPSYDLNLNPDLAMQVAQLLPALDNKPIQSRLGDADIWVPEPIPILPLDSRAPPVRG